MSAVVHFNISMFPMILTAAIFISLRRRSIQTTDNRIFGILVQATFFLLLFELLSWLVDGSTLPFARPLSIITNIIYFSLIPSVSILWLNYIYFHVKEQPFFARRSVKLLVLMLSLAVYYAILFSSPWTGLIFYLDEHNSYVRGSFNYLATALCSLYMLLSVTLEVSEAVSSKDSYERKHHTLFAVFTALPIAGSLVQFALPRIWISLPSTALSEMFVYIYLQQRAIKRDALTGINNRGCLDDYLKNLSHQENLRYSVCLFMLDLDNFKQVNDNFGHSIGDAALIESAAILKEFISGSDSFLARYGGDEFCIISRCESDEEAKTTVEQLKAAFLISNKAPRRSYTLSCSVGYCLAAEGQTVLPTQLLRQADDMLYEAKKGKELR